MIAIALMAALGYSAAIDRLSMGSVWHCEALLPGDHYSLDFVIERGEDGLPPHKFSSTRVSGMPMVTGYGEARGEKNAYYNARDAAKDEFYPYAEFMNYFGNKGISIDVKWWAKRPSLDVVIHTFNYEFRKDPARRDEKVYGLACLPQGSDSSEKTK